ncbi:MAG: hypothetical protein AAGG44_03000 [Planctomycetota bacterium]
MFFRKSKSSLKRVQAAAKRVAADALGYDYAVLGLPARESRTRVIRQAADRTLDRIQDVATDRDEYDQMVSKVLVSTYRLLDPRRRQRSVERVQLSVFSEDDWDRQRSSRQPLIEPAVKKNRRLVQAEVIDQAI